MAQGERPDNDAPERADEGSRRTFLLAGAGAVGACVAGVTLVPAASLLTHPLRTPTTSGSDAYVQIGKTEQFGSDAPVKVDVYADKVDAWNRVEQVKVGSAWVMEREGQLVAMSSVCPHLGCAIDYDGENRKFVCPCHDSFFSLDGAVETGPSPRAMDTLDVKAEGDLVALRYERFRQGTENKEPL